MKRTYRFLSALFFTLFVVATPSKADDDTTHPKTADDNPTALNLQKRVEKVSDGHYLLTLEAYATGSSVTTQSDEVRPTDIVIVMDYSSSMTDNSNKVNVITSRTQVNSGTHLETSKNYLVKIGGVEYYLKEFYDYTYTPVQDDYSYNKVNSTTYYYKHTDGKFYQVSVESKSSYYYLYYTVGSGFGATKYYLTGSGTTTWRNDASRSSTKSGTIWSGTLYSRSNAQTYICRYGTTLPTSSADGEPFGSGTGSSQYTVSSTDEIYTYTTESKTRLAVAKDAACSFVKTVYDSLDDSKVVNNEHHKIAVVRFNTQADTLVALRNVTGTSYKTIQNKINNYNTVGNGTNAHLGLQQAYNILNNDTVKTDGRKKVVVFFTDGVPGTSYPYVFTSSVATSAVEWANKLKATDGIKATVYSIAVLGTDDRNDQQMLNYLHFVSSNYPKDGIPSSSPTFTELSATTNPSMYPRDYMQVSDGSDLSSIFDKIAQESSEVETIQLDANTTSVIDVVASDFKLPDGVDAAAIASKIKVYTAEVKKNTTPTHRDDDPDPEREWYEFDVDHREALEGAQVTVNPETSEIKVKGFDFSKGDTTLQAKDGNWVGPRFLDGATTPVGYWGKELIIEIPIELKPGYGGGYDDVTNTIQSGLYKGDELIGMFPVPFVDLPSIAIAKTGMNKGESAIFEVTGPGNFKCTLVLTGTTPTEEVFTFLKNVPEGSYTVKEVTAWSWAYDGSSTEDNDNDNAVVSVTKELKKANATMVVDDIKCVKFSFSNSSKGSVPDHAEAIVTNNFGTGTIGTVTSKVQ